MAGAEAVLRGSPDRHGSRIFGTSVGDAPLQGTYTHWFCHVLPAFPFLVRHSLLSVCYLEHRGHGGQLKRLSLRHGTREQDWVGLASWLPDKATASSSTMLAWASSHNSQSACLKNAAACDGKRSRMRWPMRPHAFLWGCFSCMEVGRVALSWQLDVQCLPWPFLRSRQEVAPWCTSG